MEIKKLRKRIYFPVLLLSVILVILSFLLTDLFSTYLLKREAETHVHSVKNTMKLKMEDDLKLLNSNIDYIERNRSIIQAWLKRDRGRLYSSSHGKFERIKKKYGISHFSFHDPEKINFLRIHNPGLHTDIILRESLKKSSDKKLTMSGLELGQGGNLNYRVIRPWYIKGKITGFIEMGVSFHDVIPQVTKILSVDIVITIKKKYIQRMDWESLRRKNRDFHTWDEYRSFVILKTTLNRNNISLKNNIETMENYFNKKGIVYQADIGHKLFSCGQFKLVDIAGRHIGNIHILNSMSQISSRLALFEGVFFLLIILVSTLLLFLFWKYFGKVENELYMSLGMNESILSAVTNPMLIIDDNYMIKHYNKHTEKLFKPESSRLLNKNLFKCGIPWSNDTVYQIIKNTKNRREPALGKEIPFKNERIMGISVYPIDNTAGEISGYLLTGSDITERKITENKKNMEQKLISLGDLSAGVAHEINTPSHYIMSNLDFIKQSLDDIKALYGKLTTFLSSFASGAPIRKKQLTDLSEYIEKNELDYLFSEIPGAIDQSLEGMDHITKIVKSMKSLSRPDIGKKVRVNLNEIIDDVITISRNEWKYSAEVRFKLNHELQEILCNPSEINQVILELLINSAHAISDKIKTGAYEKGAIEISTTMKENMALISVKDDGAGIPEENRSRIFDPFFSTRDVGKGTGSGLSYVYTTVVINYGGSIDVHTREGSGTEFIVKLPVSEKREESLVS